jgi:hypothetical protein
MLMPMLIPIPPIVAALFGDIGWLPGSGGAAPAPTPALNPNMPPLDPPLDMVLQYCLDGD